VDVRIEAGATPDEGYVWRAADGRVELRASTDWGRHTGSNGCVVDASLRKFPPPYGIEAPALRLRLMFISSGCRIRRAARRTIPQRSPEMVAQFRNTLRDVLRFGYNGVTFRAGATMLPSMIRYTDRVPVSTGTILRPSSPRRTPTHQGGPYAEEAIYLSAWLETARAKASVIDPRFWTQWRTSTAGCCGRCRNWTAVTRAGRDHPELRFPALDIVHSKEIEPDPRMEEAIARSSKKSTRWCPASSAIDAAQDVGHQRLGIKRRTGRLPGNVRAAAAGEPLPRDQVDQA
jgi:hypothetical protein